MRIGIGEDIHRVDPARPLVLGGFVIPGGPGLAGHSDADVLLHAITDAVLGACALGDIGMHFPPSDARWKDADSSVFLTEAIVLAAEAGFELANIDSTVRAEQPKLAPHIDAIRARVAELAGLAISAVSVKAKTAEGLGDVGGGLAIAVTAAVLMTER